MRSAPFFHAGVFPLTGNGLSELVRDVIRILWLVAGTAMLLFTLFLAVLLVAGIAFRLWPRGHRRRPRVVFGMSTFLIVLAVTAVTLPGWAQSASHAQTRPTDASSNAIAATPMRYANRTATGNGLRATGTRSLILYDDSGADPKASELWATMLANLVSHFGAWDARPVAGYRPGEMSGYDAVFYLGVQGGAALPSGFLDDVNLNRYRVTWIDGDLDQLQKSPATVPTHRFGFAWQGMDTDRFVKLSYKDTTLTMNPDGSTGQYTRIGISDPRSATVLATASRADGSSVPWAVRSGNLTYISENPLPSQSQLEGRNLVLADLLFDAFNSGASVRHRALVRLEDIGPTTDPVQLRAVVDYLAGQGVPFSFGVYPVFRDPHGVGGNGDLTIRLSERPALVSALAYATAHGGSMVLHGYTHQYATKNNPNNGRSGDDAEFYLCHVDAGQLRLDGPVPEDSPSWVLNRVNQALTELRDAHLPRPSMFEFPHYMASATDAVAIGASFDTRYERALYFPGMLSGQPADASRPGWQMFPYAVRDIYGTNVVPENLDYVHSDGGNIPEMLAQSRSNLVVRDGVASFFFHPFLSVDLLRQMVDGLRSQGYTFVPARDVTGSA